MAPSQDLSSLNCELRIIRAKNLDFITSGTLFVRYYLLTGKNQRIQLNSQEIRSTSDPYWNESISLECSADEEAFDKLKQQIVVFELRWRNSTPILGKISGSKLLGTAEVSWMQVLESKEMVIEKWVTTVTKNNRLFDGFLKAPALQIGMKVSVPASMNTTRRRRRSLKWNECGCRDGGCNGRDEDIFAVSALEVF